MEPSGRRSLWAAGVSAPSLLVVTVSHFLLCEPQKATRTDGARVLGLHYPLETELLTLCRSSSE